jgi:voltage-gated potassium channel Kch
MRVLRLYVTLFRAMGRALAVTQVQALFVFVFLIAIVQAAVFTVLEDWAFLDGFYFAIVTMATVGYGDFAPTTPTGKLAAIVFMLGGIGVFVLAVTSFAQAFLREIFIAERRARHWPHHDGRPPRARDSAATHSISVQDREVRRVTTD